MDMLPFVHPAMRKQCGMGVFEVQGGIAQVQELRGGCEIASTKGKGMHRGRLPTAGGTSLGLQHGHKAGSRHIRVGVGGMGLGQLVCPQQRHKGTVSSNTPPKELEEDIRVPRPEEKKNEPRDLNTGNKQRAPSPVMITQIHRHTYT